MKNCWHRRASMRISIIHSLSEARSVLPGYTKHLADGREMHTMLCNIKNRTGIFPVLSGS